MGRNRQNRRDGRRPRRRRRPDPGPGPIGPGPVNPDLPAPGSEDDDFNSDVEDLGRMPQIVPGSTDLASPTSTTVEANGVPYTITEQRRRIVNDVIEQAFLQDIAAMGVWPGQVIQSRGLLVGDVAPIGPFARQPGRIQIVTDFTQENPQNEPQPQYQDVPNPSAATVDEARRRVLNQVDPTDSMGLLKTGFERATTLREVGVKLGVTVKGGAFGVDANASLEQSYKSSVVVASIRQTYYSVTFAPHRAGAAGFWPSEDVSYEDLEPYAYEGNPPLYIDSVQYGRFICVMARGDFSSSELAGALRVSYDAATKVNVNIDVRTREILERSEVKAYTVGVGGGQNFQDIADPVTGLQRVYSNGLRFSLQYPGAPISFTCRHIADQTLAHVGLAAEYTQPLSVQGVDVTNQKFYVFDGPGGGNVDTGIIANPGDAVTVSASGQIWSGVWGTGTHGPGGWTWTAGTDKPLPGAKINSLIIKFGNGNWLEAKDGRWENTLDANTRGTLILGINDDNPLNGDPNRKWEVIVNVRRANAAAAGVYI
jgi:hypothetical protein